MLVVNFSPFPQLETQRLILRQVVPADVHEIFFFRSNPTVLQYINKDPQTELEQAMAHIQLLTDNVDNNTGIAWGMALKEQPGTLIGTLGLWRLEKENYRAEIGYVMHPNHYGKGLMSEAVAAACHYGFYQMGLHTIMASINPENDGSRKVLLRNGFLKEGYFRENYHQNGVFYDSEVYGLLTPLKS